MAGFEITSNGIRELAVEGQSPAGPTLFLNVSTNGEGGDPAGNAPPPEPQALPSVVPNERFAPPVAKLLPQQLAPVDIVRAAKRRRRELKAQLRQAKRWEKELAQLERLIAAADGRPLATVRTIDSRRVS